MNKLILPLVALSIALTVTTVLAINHTLAYVSFTIVGPGPQGEFSVSPAYINLGNLTAGESGSIEAVGVLKLGVGGYVHFKLMHEDLLSREFSNFTVDVALSNYSFILTPEEDEYSVFLRPGTYNVTIRIYYVVSPYASNVTASKMPLIAVSLKNHKG